MIDQARVQFKFKHLKNMQIDNPGAMKFGSLQEKLISAIILAKPIPRLN